MPTPTGTLDNLKMLLLTRVATLNKPHHHNKLRHGKHTVESLITKTVQIRAFSDHSTDIEYMSKLILLASPLPHFLCCFSKPMNLYLKITGELSLIQNRKLNVHIYAFMAHKQQNRHLLY